MSDDVEKPAAPQEPKTQEEIDKANDDAMARATAQLGEIGKPIAFKAPPVDTTGPDAGRPTTIQDCIKTGGHGGPQGDRWYYPHGDRVHIAIERTQEQLLTARDKATAERLQARLDDLQAKNPRICEICGTVGI